MKTHPVKNMMFRIICCLWGFCIPASAQSPQPWQMHFQAAHTPVMERIIWLHDFVFALMIGVVVLVMTLLLIIIFRFRASRNPVSSKRTHNTPLEIIWTLVPLLIVGIIAVPSLRLQFYMARIQDPELTIKVVGHQWYWSYEYVDHKIDFESRIIPDKEIKADQIRLLSVDKPLVLPVNTNIRVLTTSQDVIHSWTVPAFGVKKDTIPGRLNETWMRITKEGTFHGQCSELCGVQHGFMPIEVRVVSKARFEQWVQENKPKEEPKPAPAAAVGKSNAPTTPKTEKTPAAPTKATPAPTSAPKKGKP